MMVSKVMEDIKMRKFEFSHVPGWFVKERENVYIERIIEVGSLKKNGFGSVKPNLINIKMVTVLQTYR